MVKKKYRKGYHQKLAYDFREAYKSLKKMKKLNYLGKYIKDFENKSGDKYYSTLEYQNMNIINLKNEFKSMISDQLITFLNDDKAKNYNFIFKRFIKPVFRLKVNNFTVKELF